jgi:hypothetical protein
MRKIFIMLSVFFLISCNFSEPPIENPSTQILKIYDDFYIVDTCEGSKTPERPKYLYLTHLANKPTEEVYLYSNLQFVVGDTLTMIKK